MTAGSMSDTITPRARALGIARAAIGPPALLLVAATQGVRATGPITASLAHPRPPWSLVLSDVLSVFVLATLAFWAASVLAGKRSPVAGFLVPVAASQLPMAAVALIVGRSVLGRIVTHGLSGGGEKLLADPGVVLTPVLPVAIGVAVLTALAAGVLYFGYCRVTRLTGFRLALSFVGGLVGGELLCRAWFLWTG